MDLDRAAVAGVVAEVAAAVSRRVTAVSDDVYEVILREIPQLRDDKPVQALLGSSVHSNVDLCLQIMRHQIDLADVQAPAAAVEYARRQAQRGTPLTALLRTYRLGHTCFLDWMFRELAGQADDAQAVALAAGPAAPQVVAFSEVAPVAMMLGSAELLHGWVLGTLGGLATDDEQHARLRETLLVFLRSGGSYKATAEQLTLHKNTVQYRIRKAEQSLGRPVGDDRQDVELALRVSRWLGASVLQPATH